MSEPESLSVPPPDDGGTQSPAHEPADPPASYPPPTGFAPPGYPPPAYPAGYPPPQFPGFPPPYPPPLYPAGAYPPPGFPPPGFPPPGFRPAGYLPGYPPPPGYGAPPPPPVAPGGALLADVWDRFVASIVDWAIIIAAGFIPAAIVFAVLWSRLIDAYNRMNDANRTAIDNGTTLHPFVGLGHVFRLELLALAILLPITLAITYLYLVTYMHRTGQTVGKKIMKIKVVRAADGAPITLDLARKRWLVTQAAATFAPYFFYADSLWLLWDKPYRQCLHDKCAETVVVKIKP